MRFAALIGRIGMVLLSTGLALGLVSLIPSAQMGSSYGGRSPIPAERYNILYLPFSPLTPQSGVHISVESDSSLSVYVLGISSGDFQNWTASWVKQHFPDLLDYEYWAASFNMSVLNAFLESRSETVLWKSGTTNKVSVDFFPETVIDVTGIVANPSTGEVYYTSEVRTLTSLAPKARMVLMTEVLIPIGAVLAIPWIYFTKVKKTILQ
jgi:hypothetical protein